ncbi:MAG TPA: 50S ribosomal protein L25 [Balneolaceae bacterium]|nr:50S ribosomal protein L25 [Balneolaceae bacterium]
MAKPQVIELKAEERKTGRKPAEALRDAMRIPGILYGPEVDKNISFSIDELEIENILAESKRQIIELKINGETHKTLLKSFDTHPVTDRVIHVDLYALAKDHEVTLSVPINLQGTAVGVTDGGGRVFQPMHILQIRVSPENIPGEYNIDISELQIGDSLHVKDLDLQNITPLDDLNRAIVTIRPPKSEELLTSALTTEELSDEELEALEEGEEAVEGEEATEEEAEESEEETE